MFSIVAGIVGTIGTILTAAGNVVNSLAVAGFAVGGLEKIGSVLLNLAKAIGLVKPQVQVDELGDKALQSGYDPEQYGAYAEYVKDVEEFDGLDEEKSKMIPEEDKIRKGMELAAGMMIEKYKEYPMDKLCVEVGKRPDFFAESFLKEIGKLIDRDGHYISDISSYLDGSEKDEDRLHEIVETLADVYKAGNPDVSDDDALEAVFKAGR